MCTITIMKSVCILTLVYILDAVPPPPIITSSVPASLFIANVSEDFTIFFTVISNPPITFQVYRIEDLNSPVEILTGNQTRFNYSLNETQFQLTISDLRKSDAGYYTISASNQIGIFSITVTIQPVGKLQVVVYRHGVLSSCN